MHHARVHHATRHAVRLEVVHARLPELAQKLAAARRHRLIVTVVRDQRLRLVRVLRLVDLKRNGSWTCTRHAHC